MSKLDQAFLKAYGQHNAPAPQRRRPAAGRGGTGPRSSAMAETEGLHGPGYVFLDGPHLPAAGAHVEPVAELDGAQSVAVEPVPSEQVCCRPAGGRLRAEFVVPRLEWPFPVELLVAASGNEAIRYADLVAERSRQGSNVLAVTGIGRHEGRTTVLLTVGCVLASRGLRIVMVDCDFRHPQLALRLGLAVQSGWDDVLAGRIPLAEALVEAGEEGITVLPLAGLVSQSAALTSNGRAAADLSALRDSYDVVLLDVGPLDDDAAVVSLAATVGGQPLDAALVVHDTRHTAAERLAPLPRRLAALGIRHWELAENYLRPPGN